MPREIVNGSKNTKALRRQAELTLKALDMREQGMMMMDIARVLKIKMPTLRKILRSPEADSEWITRLRMRAQFLAPKAVDAIAKRLDMGDGTLALKLLEDLGIVGKQSVNIHVNAQGANITMNNDTLEAARAVAAAMRALPAAPPGVNEEDVIDAEVIENEEENSDEHTGVNVGESQPAFKVVTGSAPKESEWFEVGEVGFAASGDRLVIEEDQFKSGYECKVCGGSGQVPSTVAGGKAKTCPECDGKGGIIVVPEVSQRRPTTGIVRSAGELCRVYKVGDGVLFSNFAGFAIDLQRAGLPVCLRILHETEVLTKVRGHLELRAISSQREVGSI